MATAGLEVFDQTTQQTQLWVNEVAKELGWEDKHKALQGLRATLHLLRDRLTIGEAAHLGAQLPILLAGFYYEGWKPERTPDKTRSKQMFLNHLSDHLHTYRKDGFGIEPEQLIRAVFKVLSDRISRGEVEEITGILPTELKELWPEEVRT